MLTINDEGIAVKLKTVVVCTTQIAVEGCCHGELDKIYETVAELEKRDNIKVDLLLCCGDFQVT